MQAQTQQSITCPYCGESMDLLIDCGELGQQYTQDCATCCKPILINVHCSVLDELSVSARSENEV